MTLKHFKTDLKAVQYMIMQSGESSWSLEKSTGISRQTIDRWIKATDLKIRRATLSDFANKLNYQIQYNKDGIAVSPHKNKQNTGDLNMEQQSMLIELQAEKIKRLEKELALSKKLNTTKPAYHFKIVGKYIQKTDTWHDAQIFGDISMLGFSHDELNDILSVEGNNPNSWVERYHPDSFEKLHESVYWKKTKSDFHHCSWEHMMWRTKNGQYVCLNIDMMYDRKEETVTTLFYYVNGDAA